MILLVCIGIAAMFWVMTVLSRSHVSTISVHLIYQHLPESLVFLESPPSALNVRVRATGWDLLANYIDYKSTRVKVDISSLADPNVLTSTSLHDHIQKAIPKDAQIIAVQPDKISFTYESKTEIMLPVKALLDLQFAQQYNLHGELTISPDSVRVTGAKSRLDTMKWWYTEAVLLENIRKTMVQRVALAQLSGFPVEVSESSVEITIPVEEFTESSVEVDIEVQGLPKDIALMLIPRKTRVTFQVALSDYDKISPTLFHARADFSSISIFENKQVQVKVDQSPTFIRSMHFTPEIVEYIIHK